MSTTHIDKARLTNMPGDWLECYGGKRHDFRFRGAKVSKPRTEPGWGRCYEVRQICQRCPKERVSLIQKSTGIAVTRHYTKVAGYDAEPGQGRLDRGDVMAELIRRAREDDW